jgi:hypothetical protein
MGIACCRSTERNKIEGATHVARASRNDGWIGWAGGRNGNDDDDGGSTAQRGAERCCYLALPYCCYLDIPHPLLHPRVKCECFCAAVGLAAAPAGVGHEALPPAISPSRLSAGRARGACVRVCALMRRQHPSCRRDRPVTAMVHRLSPHGRDARAAPAGVDRLRFQ